MSLRMSLSESEEDSGDNGDVGKTWFSPSTALPSSLLSAGIEGSVSEK